MDEMMIETSEQLNESVPEEEVQTVDEEVTAGQTDPETTEAEAQKDAKFEKVTLASKRTRRRLYGGERVYRLNDEDTARNEEGEEKRQAFLELVSSAKSKKILTGVVDGERGTELGEIAEVTYNGFTVLIPARDFVEVPEDFEKRPKTGQNSQASYLKSQINYRLGSEIDFIVRQVDEKNQIAVGSRLEAMYRKAEDHYGVRPGASSPRLLKDMIVEARIVAVSGVSITVEVFGVDHVIKQEEISWNRLAEVDAEYSVGDTVKVRIMSIVPETVTRDFFVDGKLKPRQITKYNVQASIKRAGINPNEKYYNDFVVGGNYLSQVTQVTDKGVFVRMKDKMDALCRLPDELQVPRVGDKVLVTVVSKIDDTKVIYANIKKIISHGR